MADTREPARGCGRLGRQRHHSGDSLDAPAWVAAQSIWRAKGCSPTHGVSEPYEVSVRFDHSTHGDQCRAQGSLRGRIARLRMGFVEKMPHWLPARCVQGPRRSLRGQSARRPGRDAFRSRGSSLVGVQADFGSAHANSVPSRQMACRMTASLRATAIEARFQPMRLASRSAHIFSGHDRRTRVMSTPAASYK